MTVILGLTGSIGMGKSVTSSFFRAAGCPVHDADAAVHALYAGRAVRPVEEAFPGVVVDGVIDRARLGPRVIGNPDAMRRLEAIVHPLVSEDRDKFIAAARDARVRVAVLDIPLLLEGRSSGICDAVVVVSAPEKIQRERVLARPGMTPEKFAAILARQMPDAEKRRRAHFVVDSGRGMAAAERQVRDILRALAGCEGRRRNG